MSDDVTVRNLDLGRVDYALDGLRKGFVRIFEAAVAASGSFNNLKIFYSAGRDRQFYPKRRTRSMKGK